MQALAWSDDQTLSWGAVGTAVRYHVYRDDAAAMDCGLTGTCRDDLDVDATDTTLSDGELPAPGSASTYLVTAEDGEGNEGPFSGGACVERGDPAPCP